MTGGNERLPTRVKDAERERIWAIAKAHSQGLSIRTIAKVTGLSSSRVHQLLHTDEAHQIPDWLNDLSASLRRVDIESDGQQNESPSELQQELADEGEVLRWCIEWLKKLAYSRHTCKTGHYTNFCNFLG